MSVPLPSEPCRSQNVHLAPQCRDLCRSSDRSSHYGRRHRVGGMSQSVHPKLRKDSLSNFYHVTESDDDDDEDEEEEEE